MEPSDSDQTGSWETMYADLEGDELKRHSVGMSFLAQKGGNG